jgi:hypothetical protein
MQQFKEFINEAKIKLIKIKSPSLKEASKESVKFFKQTLKLINDRIKKVGSENIEYSFAYDASKFFEDRINMSEKKHENQRLLVIELNSIIDNYFKSIGK